MSNKGHDSFYSGDNKSKNENKNIDVNWKKILGVGKKLLKWALFVFLAITTLWGCVQEFTIHSSPNLSQGIEIYSGEDQVLPNLYYTEKDFAYSSIVIDPVGEDTMEPFTNIMYPVYEENESNNVTTESVVYYVNADEAYEIN